MAQFTLLTFNINGGFELSRRRLVLPALRVAVRAVNADIMLLQEVLGAHAGHAARHRDWPTLAQHEYLADSIWPHQAYARNAVFVEGHQGNALLSRFPIAHWANHDVSVAGHEPRGLMHVAIDLPGMAAHLHLINVHLGLHESHRQFQAASLCRFVDDTIPASAPLVVGGDFNDWRRRAHGLLEASGLQEAFARTHGRLARTFPSRAPLLPLDRIYVRNLQVEGARVLSGTPWSKLSDHAGLLTQLNASLPNAT
jgi:endonuclease/exonuclease/phosphatase family metal-dependent hydrolase